jgi:hypothetical protein
MKHTKAVSPLGFMFIVFALVGAAVRDSYAHCDGLDGPVVTAARQALETGDINRVLIWVRADDDPEIRKAFQEALEVRKLSPEARELADKYFFETLVRVHRAGEGAPYTGLKPAGRDLGPAIPAADRAIETGSAEAVNRLLNETVESGLHTAFHRVLERKDFDSGDVSAGREYVEAYVVFIHYVEGLYQAAKSEAHGHFPETEEASTPLK